MVSFPWGLICAAGALVIALLVLKICFLYRDLDQIGAQLGDRLGEKTNNRIYAPGNDRHIRAFAAHLNRELGVLYESRRRYRNGDRELKEAVTNISHDLRTPLTALYGYLELADAALESGRGDPGEPDVERAVHYLAQIRNRADAMRSLTEELFRYSIILSAHGENAGSRQDSGLAGERVVLNRFLADFLLSYYDIFTQNGIEPRIRIADAEVVRFLDTGALRRVFSNILDNAVKYGKPARSACGGDMCSGQVCLSVELFADGTVVFCNSAQDLDWVSCERLFDRFYTVETGRDSTGLGLSIAKLLTERMGGSISASYADGMLSITVRL
ncbi:MAG: HAMP domain-containing histidine kinase [Lachnospiraceae bacterium]|nr:HAMP domain-containing histidine kinase [Lachnospiraceae bacterium]